MDSRSWRGINSHLLRAIFRRAISIIEYLLARDKLPGRCTISRSNLDTIARA